MKATTRRDALERGLRFYWNGKRCKRWSHARRHTDKRYATTGRCVECTIRSEVKRRKKLPARVKADAAKRQRRYYRRHRQQEIERNRAWRARQHIDALHADTGYANGR